MSQIVQTPKQQMYLTKLLGYDCRIQYKAGKHNLVADTLSCIQENSVQAYWILTLLHFQFLEGIKIELELNAQFQELKTKVQQDPSSHADFSCLMIFCCSKGVFGLIRAISLFHYCWMNSTNYQWGVTWVLRRL